jgi:hypothetical protein
MTLPLTYDEDTDPRLKKMIDYVQEGDGKLQYDVKKHKVDDWVAEEQKIITEKGYRAIGDEYYKWLEEQKTPANVGICIPSFNGNVSIQVMQALIEMFKPNFQLYFLIGHSLDAQRNQLVEKALEWKELTHIFFIDADTAPPPHVLVRLLKRDLDIVSGYYMQKTHPFAPLVIKRPADKDGKKGMNFFPLITPALQDTLLPVDAAGCGCLLIKREVFESMKPPFFKFNFINQAGTKTMGEDLYFFDQAMEIGYQPYVDLSVLCQHVMGGNIFPREFVRQTLGRGTASVERILQYNTSALLQSGGFKPTLFEELMKEEGLRLKEKAEKELEKKEEKPPPGPISADLRGQQPLKKPPRKKPVRRKKNAKRK